MNPKMFTAITMIMMSILLTSCQRSETMSNKNGLEWKFLYDEAGRITKLIDPAKRETKIKYKLDKKNQNQVSQITKIAPENPKVIYDFDQFGRRVAMNDSNGKVRYEYDDAGLLSVVHRDKLPSLFYTYDTMRRLSSISVGDEWTIQYSYDFLGRLSKMKTPAGEISYEYQNGQGKIIRTLPNGIRTVWKYYPNGNLESLSHVAGDNKILAQYTYLYRPDGLISKVKEWSPRGEKILIYEYDKVQRLTAVTDSQAGKISYSYDKFGNRIEVIFSKEQCISSSYDWAGRMAEYNGSSCAHDAAGNLASYVGRHGKKRFEYNGENLLKTNSNSRGTAKYEYDGDGSLIARIIDGRKNTFIPNPISDIWQPLLATDEAGNQTLYIWEGNYLLAEIKNDNPKFFLHNHLGSVRTIANQSGKIIKQLNYSPFGAPKKEPSESDLQPRFASLFYDYKTQLYFTRARSYEPKLGRFLQIDPQHRLPFGSKSDFSMYVYCGNDPVNLVDRTGLVGMFAFPGPGGLVGTGFPGGSGLGSLGILDPGISAPGILGPGITGSGGISLDTVSPGISGADILSTTGPGKRGGRGGGITRPPSWNPAGKQGKPFPGKQPKPGGPKPKGPEFPWPGTGPDWTPAPPTATIPPDPTGPGGQGLPPGTEIPTPPRKSLAPSNVGGIYLSGAGEALKHLGPLTGIAIDEKNGRLALLSEEKGKIDLPPLRLDDVVTVFRSVYEHGEAPFVSIDPNPKDPHGPIMFVRHGQGTANTYVGWILYHSDRVMKAYSLGCDNITREPLKSQITGYQNLFDLGFSNFGDKQKEQIWERFWIVPAEVNRRQSQDGQLTLLDVPLKVKTQRMELRGGKLVPASDDRPSKVAEIFSKWFTTHYDDISQEATLQPAAESGIDSPVALFGELHRIALLAAIAENLRDQGVHLPSWMLDYPIKQCPVDSTTPSIVVEASKTETRRVVEVNAIKTIESTQKQRIYGGVTLSAADDVVDTIELAPEAEYLAQKVLQKVAAAPLMSPVPFEKDGKKYNAVALPGNNTRDVAACRLEEVDLVVPVQRDRQIFLARKFNSFFQPSDMFGKIWTLDLPRLERRRRQIKRTEDKAEYKVFYQLTSPLNTYSESFTEHRFVREVDTKLIVPDDNKTMLGIARVEDERIGYPTQVLLFRDGKRWHFDDTGNLVAMIEAPLTIVYRRDQAHHIQRIEGWYGKNLRADMQLKYDKQSRLASVTGSNGAVVKYTYDKSGILTRVKSLAGTFDYKYKDELVTDIVWDGKVVRQFEYNNRGQLLREQRADDTEITYNVSSGPEGVKITASRTDTAEVEETVQYDAAYRPVSRILNDGTQIQSRQNGDGGTETKITLPEGDQYVVSGSPDGRKETWQLPGGTTYQVEYDVCGRMTALMQNQREILSQQWREDGQLASVFYETVALRPRYREDGILTSLLVTTPDNETKFSRWVDIKYDELGRTGKVIDYSGSEIKIVYDKAGELTALTSNRGGIQIKRDKRGKVKTIQTSWDYHQNNTYESKNGWIKKVNVTHDNDEAIIEFEQGMVKKMQQFDGGEFDISYYNKGVHKGQIKNIHTPNGLKLTYEYDTNNTIAAIDCGGVYRLEYIHDAQGRLISLNQLMVRE